jgi:GDP-L-fucose synthase
LPSKDSHAEALYARFVSRNATVGVIGLGYVGLPLVCRFAEAGFRTIGFDIDSDKVRTLKAGKREDSNVVGTGTARREFLHSDDMADACVFLLEKDDPPPHGFRTCTRGQHRLREDLNISELAAEVRAAVGSDAKVVYDSSKPDGTPRKLLDISLIRSLGWKPRIKLADGLRLAYADFLRTQGSMATS